MERLIGLRESDASELQRLLSLRNRVSPSESSSETVGRFPHHPSNFDLETVAVEVLHLLDQSPRPTSSFRVAVLTANSEQTLLHLGASLGFERLSKKLLACGTDPNQRNACGFTALHFAALCGHIGCARLLVYDGADVDIMDVWGRTAQDVALESNHDHVAEFLKAHEVDSINTGEDGNEINLGFLKETKIEPECLDFLDLSASKNPKDDTVLRSVKWPHRLYCMHSNLIPSFSRQSR